MSEFYTRDQLSLCLSDLGIRDGDCIFIHTSLKGVGKLEESDPRGMMHVLLDAMLAAVGPTGTLVAPTFNFGFCEGKPFDRQHTPSVAMGAFSEHIRTEPRALRSRHPFQCVSVIGRHADRIANAEGKSAFAQGSSFDEMLALDSKIVFFGVDFVETFVHVSEERAKVPYRFWKTFTGTYIDQGQPKREEHRIFRPKARDGAGAVRGQTKDQSALACQGHHQRSVSWNWTSICLPRQRVRRHDDRRAE